MSDEDALLAAIAAHPEEDTPRLVFADWLDEHGRPVRAEFIRVQVAIAQKDHLPRAILNRHVDLFKRNQELIDNHRAELLGPLAALPGTARVEFRRGFADEVTVDAQTCEYFAPYFARSLPQPRVVVVDYVPWVRGFFGGGGKYTGAEVRDVVAAIRTRSGFDAQDEGLQTAANLTNARPNLWPRLDELDLSGCHLGDENSARLLQPDLLPMLTNLDISANDLTDNVVDTLLASGLSRRLRRLILGGNLISDEGAIALVEQWPTGDDDRLETLNLRFTNVGQPGHQALLRRFGGRVDLF